MTALQLNTIAFENAETLEEWLEVENTQFGSFFVLDTHDREWVGFVTENADWYGTRPAGEGDDPNYIGHGVTASLSELEFPITIVTFER